MRFPPLGSLLVVLLSTSCADLGRGCARGATKAARYAGREGEPGGPRVERVAEEPETHAQMFDRRLLQLAHQLQSEPTQAEAELKRLLEEDKDEWSSNRAPLQQAVLARLFLGDARLIAGDRTAARAAYEGVLVEAPRVADDLARASLVAFANERLGNDGAAIAALGPFFGRNGAVDAKLASLAARAHHPDALRWITAVLDSARDPEAKAAAQVARAFAELERGDRARALRALQDAEFQAKYLKTFSWSYLTLQPTPLGSGESGVCTSGFSEAMNRFEPSALANGTSPRLAQFLAAVEQMRRCIAGLPAVLPTCPAEMVPIPAAAYTMGGDSGGVRIEQLPEHHVKLAPFCLDRTEVTVAAWRACTALRKCPPLPKRENYRSGALEMNSREFAGHAFCNAAQKGRDQHPVNCIDWHQAKAYCEGSGKRLPTEAEWEFAATGGDGRPWPWGHSKPDTSHANTCAGQCGEKWRTAGAAAVPPPSDGWVSTAPVGTFPQGASPFGLLDMAGNVGEWVEDAYLVKAYEQHAETNPVVTEGPDTTWRGGSWRDTDAVDISAMRRRFLLREIRASHLGVRCALTPR